MAFKQSSLVRDPSSSNDTKYQSFHMDPKINNKHRTLQLSRDSIIKSEAIMPIGPSRKPKRNRSIFTREQIFRLNNIFKEKKYPSQMDRTELSRELNLSERSIKFWFQNRRMKIKREAENEPITTETNESDALTQSSVDDKEICLNLLKYQNYGHQKQSQVVMVPLKRRSIDKPMTNDQQSLLQHKTHFETEIENDLQAAKIDGNIITTFDPIEIDSQFLDNLFQNDSSLNGSQQTLLDNSDTSFKSLDDFINLIFGTDSSAVELF